MLVKFIKSHPLFAYFGGETADVAPELVQELIKTGHIILFPGEEELLEEPKKKKFKPHK